MAIATYFKTPGTSQKWLISGSVFFTLLLFFCSGSLLAQRTSSWSALPLFQNTYASAKAHATPKWMVVDAGRLSGGGGYTISAGAPPPSYDLDQIRNGSADAPITPANWVNGNSGASNAHNAEGWGIPYRLVFTDLNNGSHTVYIQWDIRHSGKNALDFISHYNLIDFPAGSHAATFGHSPEVIDPTIGHTGLAGPTTFAIPKPNLPDPATLPTGATRSPGDEFDLLVAASKELLTIWNGTITSATYAHPGSDPAQGSLTDAQSSTTMKIEFTANAGASTVIIAWSGHIAASRNWGTGTSASSVSGSPYHTRVLEFDGKGGNQDRSLAAAAVRVPPPCTVSGPSLVCPGTTNTYSNGGATTIPADFTYLWSVSGATYTGPNNAATFQVVAPTTCNTSYTVTLTISANGTQVASCSTSTSVNDTQAPVFNTCPADVTVQALSAVPAAVTSNLATDNCGTPTLTSQDVTNSQNCYTVITRTYTATDACGNSSTCVQRIFIIDRTPPTVTCNANPAALNCGAAIPVPTATDNSGGAVSSFFRDNPQGAAAACQPFTRTWTFIDQSGNSTTCVQNITFNAQTLTRVQSGTEEVANQQPAIKVNAMNKLNVSSAPNPFTNRVRFTLQSNISGQGSLEIFNALGQKIATVYQGSIEAGKPLNKEYVAPRSLRSNLIYVFRVGDQKTSGKLLNW